MRSINYLLDENVDPDLRVALHRDCPVMTVWIVGDPGSPERGTLDPDILRWCEANDFALVTNNRSTMPVHLRDHIYEGHHVPGIFVLNPEMSMGESAEELTLVWEAAEPNEFSDQIVYLPI
ncbi:MAG: DUF5615 family PIN-like protein [Pirellulaceae bacterium]|nr:DUF5615 family PIN-like protein [Pirellulaceae bacterium]